MEPQPMKSEKVLQDKESHQEEQHLYLKITAKQMRGIAIVLAVLLISIILILFYCIDRRENILRHSPEHYFASFSEITAMDDMDVNISAYFKENGKKQVCIFDKTEKITYCYELSDDHDKIIVDRSYRRSDLPYTTLP